MGQTVDIADDPRDAGIVNSPIEQSVLESARQAATTNEAFFRAGPIFANIAGKSGSHAPTITTLPDGTLLAAWYSYDGPRELAGADIYIARRDRGSDAWSTPTRVVDRAEAIGNPVLFVTDSRVLLFYAVVPGGWSTARIEWQESRDDGVTWSPPQILSSQLGSNVRYAPIRLEDGALLLPAYDDLFQNALFFRSDDDGATWQQTARIDTGRNEKLTQPSIVSDDDGTLLLVGRNTATGALWTGRSKDAGASWSIGLDSGFPNPGAPAALHKLASGNLLLVFNDDPKMRRPLSAALSLDNGQSWTKPRVIANGDGNFAYPAVTQTADGVIHIVYSDDRVTITHAELNEQWLLEN